MVVVLCVHPPVAASEWDISVSAYGGLSHPWSREIEWTVPGMADVTGKNVSFQDSGVLGGKLSFWSLTPHGVAPMNFGIELEALQFRPNIKMQSMAAEGTVLGVPSTGTLTLGAKDLQTEIVSINFLMRYPIGVTADLPSGRTSVYFGPGVGVQTTRLRQPSVGDQRDTAPMIQGFVGVRLFLIKYVSLFAEYKYTHAHQNFDSGPTHYKFNLDSNLFVGGAGVHF